MEKTIMAVDDSASIRQMVNFTLKSEGFAVIEAEDGVDALQKLSNNRVSMILTDLNMPRMDGMEFIRRVRQEGTARFVPIVMLTTESQSEKKMAGKAVGATGWIVKPFKPQQLMMVVRKLLGNG